MEIGEASMNRGTKIRVILYIIAILNQANVSIGVWEFGDERINSVYKVFSYLLTLGATAAALWYNNDFTEEGAVGTSITREMKATRNCATETAEEPEDSYIVEDEYIEEAEDGEE